MSEKRGDNVNRILRTEKNLPRNVTFYHLENKEKEIWRDLNDGIDTLV